MGLSSLCQECKNTISSEDKDITCNNCRDMFHTDCVNISQYCFEVLQKSNFMWFCNSCIKYVKEFIKSKAFKTAYGVELGSSPVSNQDYDDEITLSHKSQRSDNESTCLDKTSVSKKDDPTVIIEISETTENSQDSLEDSTEQDAELSKKQSVNLPTSSVHIETISNEGEGDSPIIKGSKNRGGDSNITSVKNKKSKRQMEDDNAQKSHKEEALLACPLCSFNTTSKKVLKVHILQHDFEKLECSTCRYKTKCRVTLERHMKRHITLKCSHCSFKTSHHRALKAHIRKHDNMFKCSECDFKTNWITNLKIHTRKHNEKKVLKCPVCNFRATHKKMLEKHALKHGKQKVFSCSLCTFKTSFGAWLKAHMRFHKKKLLQCSECDFKTLWERRLRYHLEEHRNL